MKELTIDGYKFLTYEIGKAVFVFSTAENQLNFNKTLPEGLENLDKLKKWFAVDTVAFSNQTHSDIVTYYKNCVEDGDCLVSSTKNVALGVFTADCVPILLYDKGKEAISAVHSGWRGTSKAISIKAVNKMVDCFNSSPEDIIAIIGPHNRKCCYEVGEEVLQQFKKQEIYKDIEVSSGNNLNLFACIEKQLLESGLKKENIIDMNYCTYCSKEQFFHSYRKSQEGYSRMFSFVYLKQ